MNPANADMGHRIFSPALEHLDSGNVKLLQDYVREYNYCVTLPPTLNGKIAKRYSSGNKEVKPKPQKKTVGKEDQVPTSKFRLSTELQKPLELVKDLQLPPSQTAQSTFREQRRQKLKEHLLKRKTFFAYKQENQILSSGRDKRVKTSEENVGRPTGIKNNITMEENCIPLKPSSELTNSTTAIDTPNFEDNKLCCCYQLKMTPKKNQSKVLTCPRNLCLDLIVAKLFSLRLIPLGNLYKSKMSSATMKNLSATVSKATKSQPVDTSSVTLKSDRASHTTTATKFVSPTSQSSQLVRPSIRSPHSNNQDAMKQGISRMSASVTVWKGPREKELLQLNTVSSIIKTCSSQDIERNKALSRSMTSEMVARPASSSNTKLREKQKALTSTDTPRRWTQRRETAEERKARLREWKASKGRVMKRPPSSVVTQPEPEAQNEKPVGSFWTTMAEEDEQRLFPEKVNKTFSECLNLINEGYPREEVLVTLNDLIKNIPDAKNLVKHWICLLVPIENIIAIYETILAGAQPIEEMRHATVDILTMKSQEKVKFGENIGESCATKEQIQEATIDDISVNLGLKFLTPVRRFRCLQDKTSKLPDMLKDHYPCVSSLEQLRELESETDAFVCCPSAALCRMYSETDKTEENSLTLGPSRWKVYMSKQYMEMLQDQGPRALDLLDTYRLNKFAAKQDAQNKMPTTGAETISLYKLDHDERANTDSRGYSSREHCEGPETWKSKKFAVIQSYSGNVTVPSDKGKSYYDGETDLRQDLKRPVEGRPTETFSESISSGAGTFRRGNSRIIKGSKDLEENLQGQLTKGAPQQSGGVRPTFEGRLGNEPKIPQASQMPQVESPLAAVPLIVLPIAQQTLSSKLEKEIETITSETDPVSYQTWGSVDNIITAYTAVTWQGNMLNIVVTEDGQERKNKEGGREDPGEKLLSVILSSAEPRLQNQRQRGEEEEKEEENRRKTTTREKESMAVNPELQALLAIWDLRDHPVGWHCTNAWGPDTQGKAKAAGKGDKIEVELEKVSLGADNFMGGHDAYFQGCARARTEQVTIPLDPVVCLSVYGKDRTLYLIQLRCFFTTI
ncbi:hypothetical protein EI555_015517 [Monodon monoceros]|uniref:Cytoskeleton-associated protein 2 C-terminal domain-containing protein n=1 Tax=Monodon monoceros TaxID=40151 RepID=A0A4U1FUL7_MONMO|nr:hypothetical protein EI555_015517 [Monodon monoceros]